MSLWVAIIPGHPSTIDQMGGIIKMTTGKDLSQKKLIVDNELNTVVKHSWCPHRFPAFFVSQARKLSSP